MGNDGFLRESIRTEGLEQGTVQHPQAAQPKLTVVTTPFKKGDVRCKIVDDVLTVTCGTENVKDAENEDVIYRGISSQSYSFSLKLGESIDKSGITAENKDGLLTINLPYVKPEEKKPEEIEISIA